MIIVSATLAGVETLKYSLFHGICFFVEIFSFFGLVSDIFNKWNFSKNGFELLVLRYWFIYIFDTKTIKITFTLWEFSMITIFTLINSFTCVFQKKTLNVFVCFITPVVEKWLIHMKMLVASPALFILSRVLWLTIRQLRRQIEVVRKSLYVSASYRG